MELKLSCFRCDSSDFNRTEQKCYDIEGGSYSLHEDVLDSVVICSECGFLKETEYCGAEGGRL